MTKAKYIDGFVFAVPKKNAAAYKKMAREAAIVWRKFGALDYKECRGDDMRPQHVTRTFPKLVKPKAGEEVWFSFVAYKSRAHRDQVNKKVMAHFDKKYAGTDMRMPFDMNRMSMGGFSVEVG